MTESPSGIPIENPHHPHRIAWGYPQRIPITRPYKGVMGWGFSPEGIPIGVGIQRTAGAAA